MFRIYRLLVVVLFFVENVSYLVADRLDMDFNFSCLAPKTHQLVHYNHSLQLKLINDFVNNKKITSCELNTSLGFVFAEVLERDILYLSSNSDVSKVLNSDSDKILLSWPKATQQEKNNEVFFTEKTVGVEVDRAELLQALQKIQQRAPQTLQKILAWQIYSSLSENLSAEEIKETFSLLEVLYPGGAQSFLYEYHFKKTRMELVETDDIIAAGKAGAVRILAKMQHWLETKGINTEEKFLWMMATGKTPDIMLDFIDRLWREWDTSWAQKFLQENGITKKLPMDRLIITHLDTTLPQQRSVYHAFPTYINRWAEKFGVPEDQRKLWYGDLTLDDEKRNNIRVMTDNEFTALMSDIDKRGFLIEKFKRNELKETDFQYNFLKAMQIQCEKMSAFLKEYGGPDLVIGSCGPSYEGFGHVGFVESGFGNIPTSFIGQANYHNAGAQGMLNGGYSNMLDSNGNIKYGYATFAIPEMTMKEDAEMVMLINGNNSKEQSVRYAIEGDYEKDFPNAPVVGLGKSKGAWIVDPSTYTRLRKNYYPWDMQILPENFWTEEGVVNFFIKVVKDAGKINASINITNITMNDFLNYGFRKGDVPPMIRWIRLKNLENLTKVRSWEEWQNIVSEKLIGNLKKPSEVDSFLWGKEYVKEMSNVFNLRNELKAKLKSKMRVEHRKLIDRLIAIDEDWVFENRNKVLADLRAAFSKSDQSILDEFLKAEDSYLSKRKTIFMPDPHPDDRYLAIQSVIDIFLNKGHRVITKTLTPGSSAVSNNLVVKFIDQWSLWTQEQINEAILIDREKASIKLVDVAKKNKLERKKEALDFNHWDKLSEEEKNLRSQLLFSYIYHKYCEGDALDTPEKIIQLKELVRASFAKKKLWGAKNLKIVDTMKTYVRVIEEKSAMLSWGVPYRNVYDPASFAWYSPVGKNGAARPEDIDYFVNLFESLKRVDLVFGNDENFIDFGAHSITKSIILGTLKKLKEKGYFDNNPDFRFMGYAGVWDGIPIENAGLTVMYSPQEKNKFFEEFWQIYMSQVPAEGCDPSVKELNTFADAVIERGEKTREEYLELLKPDNKKIVDLRDSAYALSFTVKNIFAADFDEQLAAEKKLLETIGPELKAVSTEILYGKIKSANMLNDFSEDALFRLYMQVKGLGEKAVKDLFSDLEKSGYTTNNKLSLLYDRVFSGNYNSEKELIKSA